MNLYGRTLDELTAFAEEQGLRRYRATQIAEWLYHHHASEINEMSNLPQELRERWQKEHSIGAPLPENAGKSSDGTRKYTWPAFGGDIYEAALIPADERLTLCVSSQAGCRIGCKFCLTAKKGLKQNLSAAEILGQYRNLPERERVTHFVYMGMGEPLDNTDEVLKSIEILTSDWGYGFSPRRITVSSVGILPDFERLLDETEVNVAVSLHAAKREDRLPLVPSENRYPIATIVELLKHRASLALPPFTGSGRRKFSFEVTMLRGVTDRPEQAVALRNLIQGVPARVNLIPWNSFPGTSFEPSLREDIERYQGILRKAGITATIRESRGEDIGAACGLLAGKRAQAAGATQ
ncbi:MAG: 23S rRNA (adenine(2503)-C(2))-methyltransferase RlmN [Spirochaetales bacterium]